MFFQQDEMVWLYLFSFREAGCPLFWISEFCLRSVPALLKCQQNLVQIDFQPDFWACYSPCLRQELEVDFVLRFNSHLT